MVCPRCRISLAQDSLGPCPGCGIPYSRLTSVVMKTSSVLIAARGERQVYRSVSDVPANLRKTLHDSTNGVNSATVLIADRRGKEEIAREWPHVSASDSAGVDAPDRRVLGLAWRNWLGIAIGVASGAAAWLFCAHYW